MAFRAEDVAWYGVVHLRSVKIRGIRKEGRLRLITSGESSFELTEFVHRARKFNGGALLRDHKQLTKRRAPKLTSVPHARGTSNTNPSVRQLIQRVPRSPPDDEHRRHQRVPRSPTD